MLSLLRPIKIVSIVSSFVMCLCCPIAGLAQDITLQDVKDFLSDKQDIYVEADKTTYQGVDIYKLWERAGIKPYALYGSDEYLYAYKMGSGNTCYLYYPSVEEHSKGHVKALRVTGSIPWDYQYYFFRKDNDRWIYFDHMDINGQKYEEPELVFLNDSLLYFKVLAASGTSNYENIYDIYSIQDDVLKSLCHIPADGWHQGWGSLMGRKFKSRLKYSQNKLSVSYVIDVYAYDEDVDYKTGGHPLFRVKRKVLLNWDGKELSFDKEKSQITKQNLENLFNGRQTEYYAMFKPDFDNLQYKNKKKRDWYGRFIERIANEKNPE